MCLPDVRVTLDGGLVCAGLIQKGHAQPKGWLPGLSQTSSSALSIGLRDGRLHHHRRAETKRTGAASRIVQQRQGSGIRSALTDRAQTRDASDASDNDGAEGAAGTEERMVDAAVAQQVGKWSRSMRLIQSARVFSTASAGTSTLSTRDSVVL